MRENRDTLLSHVLHLSINARRNVYYCRGRRPKVLIVEPRNSCVCSFFSFALSNYPICAEFGPSNLARRISVQIFSIVCGKHKL